MLGIMGINISMNRGGYWFKLSDEEIMKEFDDIRFRFRRCETDFRQFDKEEFVIPRKIKDLKLNVEKSNKMYEMIPVLEREWMVLKLSMREFKRTQLSL